ncbi:MAG: hypothetical protein J6N49_00770 [Alphaproteobacteria bacterium]|nr:hypothetical protein [Alphaproteobacteria bacterium]
MTRKVKLSLKKICAFILGLAVLWWIVQANIKRFNDNLYANYEKIVDYGRVRENEEVISPVMAAIFYDDKVSVQKSITSYYNHFDNYKKRNVKMVVVPKDLTPDSRSIIRRLYAEIYKYNQVDDIALVLSTDSDVSAHIKMLKKVMQVNHIKSLILTEENLEAENIIDSYLKSAHKMIVVLADLSDGFNGKQSDFLLEETIYFAQKNFYHMEVFDVIDTKIAQSVDKDYRALLSLTNNKDDQPMAVKQQRNLRLFATYYKKEIKHYLKMNLNAEEDIVWPEKTTGNFRLFDRGWVYVRFYDEEMQEVFARKAIDGDKGVIVSLIEIARKAAMKTDAKKIKYIKISLLTDAEELSKDKDTLLISYLDQDDGIMIRSGSKKALLVADERPDDPSELEKLLRQKAEIPDDEPEENIQFYKFKSVEIEDEN